MARTDGPTGIYGIEPPDGDPGTGYTPAPPPAGTTPATPTPPPSPPATVSPPVAVVPSALTATTLLLNAQIVPLDASPSQVLAVQLGTQACRIDVYQKSTGLFLDLYVADVAVVLGVLCRDRNVLVVNAYLGFTGDLTFIDTQGSSDPYYDGLGTRWQLVWLSAP